MSEDQGSRGKCRNAMLYGNNIFIVLLLSFLIGGLPFPGNVSADEVGYGPGQDSWKFQVGGYFPSINSNMQVKVYDTNIDLEDSLGLEGNDSIFRLDGYWRFARNHRLKFGYYSFNRGASKTLEKELIIDGDPWYAGAFVKTEWDMDFYKISYLYSFYQDEKWEIAGFIGTYWVRIKAALELAAGLDVPPPGPGLEDLAVGDRFESESFEGPLPLLGLSFDYYITPKWMASFRAGYFQLTINEYTGKILNLGANVEYQFTKMFGLGLGYDDFRLNVEAEDKGSFADVDYNYSGVQVYGILRF